MTFFVEPLARRRRSHARQGIAGRAEPARRPAGRHLFHSLAMPQIPDRLRICDEDGAELYAGAADGAYSA
ncbi:hypothetical protein [Mesorhizobium sp. M0029]|uniref:hypothetical protein n=1 Tax=Mesorhizobium sp. M0029 TaxID=2956850 RepID=UPI00333B2089